MPQKINSKWRPPLCAVTKEMAEAGKLKMETLVGLELETGVTDDQLVAEVFHAMWQVYWRQVRDLQGKQLSAPPRASLIVPQGFIRN